MALGSDLVNCNERREKMNKRGVVKNPLVSGQDQGDSKEGTWKGSNPRNVL
jgi:hypothetical protein